MKIFFIRHAKAVSRDEWSEDDLLRPLSKKGVEISENFFEKISLIFDIDIIISSKATRAIQTAKILSKFYPNAIFQTSTLLNPGCSFNDIKILIDEYSGYENIALVGHEPDISLILNDLLGCERVDVKKSSIIECEGRDLENLELKSFIYPKLLRGFKK